MSLTVLTMNLLYGTAVNPAGAWNVRLPLVLDILRSGPDIVALQEATVSQLRDIDHSLSEFTIVSGPESGETRMPRLFHRATRRGRQPDARRGEHCAILYRTERFEALEGSAFWLSHDPHEAGSVLPGTWLPRVVNWVRLKSRPDGGVVTVYNAHLDFVPWAPLRSARILRHIMDTHWNGAPQILMGDFNAHPRSGAYEYLGSVLEETTHPALQDAWLVTPERSGPEGTYHGGTGRVRWMGRLDRILFRPDLSVQRVTTITHGNEGRFPSDHYPVMAVFKGENSRAE